MAIVPYRNNERKTILVSFILPTYVKKIEMSKISTLVVAISLAIQIFPSAGATQEQLMAPPPVWSAPAPISPGNDALYLQSGALKLAHDPGSLGAFELQVREKGRGSRGGWRSCGFRIFR